MIWVFDDQLMTGNASDEDAEVDPAPPASGHVQLSAEHRLRMSPRQLPGPGPKPRHSMRRGWLVRRLLVAAVLVALSVAVLALFRDVANPDYPEAAAVADHIHDAWWEDILGEGVTPEEAAATADLQVFTYGTQERPVYVLTHQQPTSDGVCYALRFGDGILTEAGTLLDPGPGCTPQSQGQFDSRGAWSAVLPSERITPLWFVPAMGLLIGGVLFVLTGITIGLITEPPSRRRRPPQADGRTAP